MKLGTTQNLTVSALDDHGAILTDGEETILLPNKEVEELKEGDNVDVFIYKDSKDRPIATRKTPKLQLGEIAPLKVLSTTRIGAFLDWGLDKDLLLPFKEQTTKVQEGREYLVQLYEDKTGRLAATMKVYPSLSTDSNYKKGDWVEGYVYQINPKQGAFVAVDNKYNGMIPIDEVNDSVHNGNTVKVRVVEVRPDGKLRLSPTKTAYKEIVPDASKILTLLEINNGFLPFNDKSSPEAIKAEFDISKGAFKKALGHLLKYGFIEQTEDGIKRKEEV